MLAVKQKIASNEPERDYSLYTSIEHRKKFAQFFTPFPIAQFMADWLAGNNTLQTVLDPAFGLGVFARALREISHDYQIKGFEIDTHIYRSALSIFRNYDNISIIKNDYMFNDWENKYDGIICNPPYFKFHDYDSKNIIREVEERIGIKLNGFTNFYTLFLLKSIYQLNYNGRAAYIVPSEFLNSDYGKLVKSYLIKNKALRYVIIIDFEENVFDDALTTASILLFANDNNLRGVEFINIKTLKKLEDVKSKIDNYPNNISNSKISFCDLNPEIKWKAYYQIQNSTKFKHLVPFTKFGKVVRGIATGANKYFTFNLSKAKQQGIGEEYLLPCICKSTDVQGAFFTQEDFEKVKQENRSVFLFNAVDPNDTAVKKYLEKGVAEKVHKKFLTASRNPWYSLENRPPSPIWVSVFNRNGLRFIRNEAGIRNLTTFHCIYTNIFSAPKVDLLFAYLLTNISKQILKDNCREYGNGLQKFEPNDINKANIIDLDRIDQLTEERIIELYRHYKQSEIPVIHF